MNYSTLKDVIDSYGSNMAPSIVQALLKTSGILETARMVPATHGAFDKVPVFDSLPTASFIPMNGSVTPMAVTARMEQSDLMLVKSVEYVDYDYANGFANGIDGYIASRLSTHGQAIANALAKQIYYGYNSEADAQGFKGVRQVAIANGNYSLVGADSTNLNHTSVTAVKWNDNCSLVYNPSIMTTGELVKFAWREADITTDSTTSATQTRHVWIVEALSMIGLRLVDPSNVYALVNIIKGTNDVDLDDMTTMVDAVKATAGDTIIYASRSAKRSIEKALKYAKLEMLPGDSDFTAIMGSFDGINIAIEENIITTEDGTAS